MDSTDLSVLRTTIDWLRSGRRAALATVVQTWGSSPRPRGAWLAIRDDGQVVGSVSGGCVEDDLICQVRDGILQRDTPDDAILALGIDDQTAIVALTHDPKLDDMALLEALKSPAFYIGALGSRRTTAARMERLALFDLSHDEIARLHGPVGLYIGARSPAEMAISILAEITATRHQVPVVQRRDALPAASA